MGEKEREENCERKKGERLCSPSLSFNAHQGVNKTGVLYYGDEREKRERGMKEGRGVREGWKREGEREIKRVWVRTRKESF